MNKPSIGINDDYICLDAKNASFYYGYEVGLCKDCGIVDNGDNCPNDSDHEVEWCFKATCKGIDEVIIIPESKLGGSDRFDVTEKLLAGIGWVLAKYNLTIK